MIADALSLDRFGASMAGSAAVVLFGGVAYQSQACSCAAREQRSLQEGARVLDVEPDDVRDPVAVDRDI